jgi:hypothetical protein
MGRAWGLPAAGPGHRGGGSRGLARGRPGSRRRLRLGAWSAPGGLAVPGCARQPRPAWGAGLLRWRGGPAWARPRRTATAWPAKGVGGAARPGRSAQPPELLSRLPSLPPRLPTATSIIATVGALLAVAVLAEREAITNAQIRSAESAPSLPVRSMTSASTTPTSPRATTSARCSSSPLGRSCSWSLAAASATAVGSSQEAPVPARSSSSSSHGNNNPNLLLPSSRDWFACYYYYFLFAYIHGNN